MELQLHRIDHLSPNCKKKQNREQAHGVVQYLCSLSVWIPVGKCIDCSDAKAENGSGVIHVALCQKSNDNEMHFMTFYRCKNDSHKNKHLSATSQSDEQ